LIAVGWIDTAVLQPVQLPELPIEDQTNHCTAVLPNTLKSKNKLLLFI